MDKFKLLSSTSGVGAIIATKTGNYILISSINKWPFIQNAMKIIQDERSIDLNNLIDNSTKRIKNEIGINTIDDERFVSFLKISENLTNLILLLPLPEIELHDLFNTPVWENKKNPELSHPIKRSLINSTANNYMVQATHFPKWFIGKNGKLQTLDKWRVDWANLSDKNQNVKTTHFAPPRDFESIKIKNLVWKKIDSDNSEQILIHNELIQSNLALICEHGHLMDIPWSKYININNIGLDPVDIDEISNCCGNPALKWTESTNKSEGFENIYIHCENCNKKRNLSGINSFKCYCKGYKPWEVNVIGGFKEKTIIPYENCTYNGRVGEMQVSLVTANRMYYATGKNSLYIPVNIKPKGFENQDLVKALKFCETRYDINTKREPEKTKENWFNKKVDEDFLIEDGGIEDKIVNNDFINQLKDVFLTSSNEVKNEINGYDDENYRLFEYKCFTENTDINQNGLIFNSVNLSENLSKFFKSVKQVSELKLTQVQLSFNRNKPRVGFQNNDGKIGYTANAKRIFEVEEDKQFVLPAVQNYGEGIFIQFNEKSIKEFINDKRIQSILDKKLDKHDQGYGTWEMLNRCGQKYYIIHSFSHLIMRELEFACGYPTSSLKERLYISSNENEFMAGILIYTTDGAEGSMGGLVSQASEDKIENLIRNALLRSVNCSSDPLCWESEGQGLFGYNFAACFSCSLVAETACEAMNLGLDRRILVDEEFGFFKNMNYEN